MPLNYVLTQYVVLGTQRRNGSKQSTLWLN